MKFIVEWQTRVGMGYTFYSGEKTINAESLESAVKKAKDILARDFDRRKDDIIINSVKVEGSL